MIRSPIELSAGQLTTEDVKTLLQIRSYSTLDNCKSMMVSTATWTTLVLSSLLVGILICGAQFYLARRIIRAKTDVPIFNQLFALCLIVSGLSISADVVFLAIYTSSSVLANETPGFECR